MSPAAQRDIKKTRRGASPSQVMPWRVANEVNAKYARGQRKAARYRINSANSGMEKRGLRAEGVSMTIAGPFRFVTGERHSFLSAIGGRCVSPLRRLVGMQRKRSTSAEQQLLSDHAFELALLKSPGNLVADRSR